MNFLFLFFKIKRLGVKKEFIFNIVKNLYDKYYSFQIPTNLIFSQGQMLSMQQFNFTSFTRYYLFEQKLFFFFYFLLITELFNNYNILLTKNIYFYKKEMKTTILKK